MCVFVVIERRWLFQMCWSDDITDDAQPIIMSINVWAAVAVGGENASKVDKVVHTFNYVSTYYNVRYRVVNESYDVRVSRPRRDQDFGVTRPRRDRDIGVAVSRRDRDVSATSLRRDVETFKRTSRDVRSKRCSSHD